MTISLRLSDEDTKLFKRYAAFHNMTVSEMIRQSVLERIEDEYDLKVFAEYEKEAGTLETYSHEEV